MRPNAILPFLFVFLSVPAFGYVLQMDRDSRRGVITMHWTDFRAQNGIAYWVNVSSFPFSESDVMGTVRNSFAAWEGVETSFVKFQEQGTGNFRGSSRDLRSVVVYDPTGGQIGAPAGSGVIAVTRVNWNNRGEILDADIIFNGRDFEFSIFANATLRGQIDLQDVLTHEIGHFLGLDHTPLVGTASTRPTMNPFQTADAPRQARSLEMDDRAGVAALYPFEQGKNVGTISGHVIHEDGQGAFGVHVVAYRAGTQEFVVSALSGTTGEGGYEISGLPPGKYQVAIEPVSRGITHENFGGIFNSTFERSFAREFYDNQVEQRDSRTFQVQPGRQISDIDFVLGLTRFDLPIITNPVLPVNTPDEQGPYRVSAQIRDDQGIVSADLKYRINGGTFRSRPLIHQGDDLYVVDLSGQVQGTVVKYQLQAQDGDGNRVFYPASEDSLIRFEVIAFSGKPVLYIAGRQSGTLSVFDTGLEREVARIPTGGETPLSVALAGGDRYVFVTNTGSDAGASDNRVTVIETATHRVVDHLEVGAAPLDVAVSPDGARVYVTNSRARSVSVLDAETLREIRRLETPTVGPGPFGIVISPDGARVYVTDIDGDQVLVLDADSGSVLQQIQVVSAPRSLAIHPNGKKLYVAGFNGNIWEVDLEQEGMIRTISTAPARGIFRLSLSPDGQRLYASDPFEAQLLMVDLTQGFVTDRISTGGQNTRDLVVSEDGAWVYVTSQDSNDLQIFDVLLNRFVKSFKIDGSPRGIAIRTWRQNVSQADFDGSGQVDFSDFLLFAGGYGILGSDLWFDPRFDLDGNNQVGFSDFLIFAGIFGRALNTTP